MNGVFWAGLLLGGLLAIVVNELLDVSAWAAPRLVKRASNRLPSPSCRDRYREEWLAELAAFDGLKLVKLIKAIGIWYGSFALAADLTDVSSFGLWRYLRVVSVNIPATIKYAWRGKPIDLSNDGSFLVDAEGWIRLGYNLEFMAADDLELDPSFIEGNYRGFIIRPVGKIHVTPRVKFAHRGIGQIERLTLALCNYRSSRANNR